ncbi:DgyrCDS8874 [Dimorphilus gyrociliatus]|uniref:Zinc transporter ZIP11 n=1 Tax=Dimorphilus gyrociliatus TaxID=2664684 RepID=A0A7I8VVD0_9ANNE|nr:DgyrCDS8874 [Dimorphilus gyrociliatus]
MIPNIHPVLQTCLGTAFTWGLTAVGAALVFVFSGGQRRVLDGSLGFAAGVMTAASFWSLLAPAIELAEKSGLYGENGEYSFIPVAIGFGLGALFVYGADIFLPFLGINDPTLSLAVATSDKVKDDADAATFSIITKDDKAGTSDNLTRRHQTSGEYDSTSERAYTGDIPTSSQINWKRIMLLIIAITIHNIPEGLAVGVGFGAVGKTSSATFENARNLAIGIGIQNFPEGLAVSLPLKGSGMSTWKCFFYGQLSGMVEPIAGILGALAVVLAEPILPYALAFAAGAMIYVVVDDIIPEAQLCGNGKLASWTTIIGFIVMMILDVGLG